MSDADRPVGILFSFARTAAREGRKAEARRLLVDALRLAPERADLWIWLAGVTPSPRASLGYLARALTLEPRNPHARAGLRWARRQAAGTRPPGRPMLPPSPVRSRRGWLWAGGALLVTLVIMTAVALFFFPDLTALAAGEKTPPPEPPLALAPLSTPPALPTRTPDLPPTWTPTNTFTPSPTPSPTITPTATLTPTPTETPPPPSPTWVPTALPPPVPPVAGGERWIDVNLSQQLVIAYEGEIPVRWVSVSTGLPRTPTVVGQFRIYVKYVSTTMSGDDYYLPNVPYTMYFYKGYGLHGTYWHSNFGYPMSHGCVNLPTTEAEWLFNFASVGTLVNVHY